MSACGQCNEGDWARQHECEYELAITAPCCATMNYFSFDVLLQLLKVVLSYCLSVSSLPRARQSLPLLSL